MHTDKKQEQRSSEVKERDDMFVVEVELAGYLKEEIQASFNDGYLIVKAQKPQREQGESPDVPATDRSDTESMQHAFFVGKAAAPEHTRAAFHNGLLKVMIPKDEKREVCEPCDIEIM